MTPNVRRIFCGGSWSSWTREWVRTTDVIRARSRSHSPDVYTGVKHIAAGGWFL